MKPDVVVDIGNTRLKLGLFEGVAGATEVGLPAPVRTLHVAVDRLDEIAAWLRPHGARDVSWQIGSVQRSFTTELIDWLRRNTASQIVLRARRMRTAPF